MNTRFQTAPWSLCYFWWVRRGLGYVLNSRGNQRPPQAGFFADLGDVLHKNHVAGFHSGTYFRRKTHPKILKNSGKIPPKIGILHFKFSRHFTLTFRNLGQPRREGTWNENQHSDALIDTHGWVSLHVRGGGMGCPRWPQITKNMRNRRISMSTCGKKKISSKKSS